MGSAQLTAALFTACFVVLTESSSGDEMSKNIDLGTKEISSSAMRKATAGDIILTFSFQIYILSASNYICRLARR